MLRFIYWPQRSQDKAITINQKPYKYLVLMTQELWLRKPMRKIMELNPVYFNSEN